ncbi:MAG: MBL fold metallo-hydrolase [Ramlibacter sp.]|nr:MBL fold metallo-hydrolase [Ramlibacter sp.]
MSFAAHDLPKGVSVLERGWLSANNVVFAEGVTAVVDTGYCSHSRQTVALVRQVLGGAPLDLIANTHLHSDHCGGNAGLQTLHPGARTLIPPGLSDHVRRWDPEALTYAPTGQICPRFTFDDVLVSGQEIQLGHETWQIHSAPGHDPHSVILMEPKSRTMISADALWENGFGVVFQELEGEQAFDEVAATLDLIEVLQPVTIIPGHGSVFTDVSGALERARARLAHFQKHPRGHARHGVKVLLKFKLLDVGQIPVDDLLRWAESTRYFEIVHARFFADEPQNQWLEMLISELVRSGVARREQNVLIDS